VLDQGVSQVQGDGDYVQFWEAGTQAKGEFHCSDCGYGVTVQARLPVCPMCAGRGWEQSTWSPFTRSAAWPL
jgi:rubrerythrin